MQILYAALTFSLSSLYVLFLDSVTLSSPVLQKVIVVPIVLFLLLLYYSSKSSGRLVFNPRDKWAILFGVTVFIHMLVLATGGLHSPFLIVIHLCMIGIGFLFSFAFSLLFLIASFVVLYVDITFYQNFITVLIEDPRTILLFVSFIPIIPLTYLISQQYHAKDVLFGLMKTKVATDETIFQTLREMIIVTDQNLRILSANDAVGRTLQRSNAELLDKPLFDVLLLKDENGKLVKKQTFFPDDNTTIPPQNTNQTFTLFQSSLPKRTVTMQVKPVTQQEENVQQISFIISFTNASEDTLTVTLEKARARYEALLQNIKKQLQSEAKTEVLLLEKVEQDTYLLQTLHSENKKREYTRIDLARLCKETMLLNQDFAKAFHVEVNFSLLHFGQEDIAPLTVANYPVTPEELTGPFFTVECDNNRIEHIIKKLLDLTIFLASNEHEPKITFTVERGKEQTIVIKFAAPSPDIAEDQLQDIFVPYYGRLAEKGNLRVGSGLEGFLVKKGTDALGSNLAVTIINKEIIFALTIAKHPGR